MIAVRKALGCNPTLADKAAKKALELDLRLQEYRYWGCKYRCARSEDRERWKEGLLRAGFPL
jgi:hypothetical protein